MPTGPRDFVFETGVATTNSNGEATITLDCFRFDEVPCIILTSFDTTGNANANLAELSFVGPAWNAKIITSAPNITVHYRAITATAGNAEPFSLITQDFLYLLTQDNEEIQIQIS
jgi:hypothetical protein